MARYIYFCSHCQERFEVEKSMSLAPQPESCPKCQNQGERIFTAPGVQIKGAPIKFECPSEKKNSCDCSSCAFED